MAIRLFGSTGSPNVYRVVLALEEKGLDYELLDPEGDEFLKGSRWGLMPCLEYEGKYYFESMAIVEWLDEAFPEQPLLPSDLHLRANARAWAHHIVNQVLSTGAKMAYNADNTVKEQAQRELLKLLQDVDKQLHGKEFLVADQYTVADLNLTLLYPSLRLQGVTLENLPNLQRHMAAMTSRRSFQKSDPSEQIRWFYDKMRDPTFRKRMAEQRRKRMEEAANKH